MGQLHQFVHSDVILLIVRNLKQIKDDRMNANISQ